IKLNMTSTYSNFVVHISDEFLYIQSYQTNEVIAIDRLSNEISLKDQNSIPTSATQKPIDGIVGSIKLVSEGHYLIVITGKSKVGVLNEHDIWKCEKFEMIPFYRIQINYKLMKKLKAFNKNNIIIRTTKSHPIADLFLKSLIASCSKTSLGKIFQTFAIRFALIYLKNNNTQTSKFHSENNIALYTQQIAIKKINSSYKSMVENFLLTQNFYFSYTYDLTLSLQKLQETSPEFLALPLFER
ncbi:phosphatidylinositide phosphatase SAC1, partial [Brachionus plicatilis]